MKITRIKITAHTNFIYMRHKPNDIFSEFANIIVGFRSLLDVAVVDSRLFNARWW